MEFYVDIADLEQVKAVAAYYPIDGFTTNPAILSKSEQPLAAWMQDCRDYIGQTGLRLFVQVTSDRAEEMLAEAKKLRDWFGDHLNVKIPVTKEGIRAICLCREQEIPVTATVVHSEMQAIVAAKAGAAYVAPYVSHIDNIGADGIRCVEGMLEAFGRYGWETKVLAASFRTVDQIMRLAAIGCHAVTVTPQMFDALIAHPSTEKSVAGFAQAWRDRSGSRRVTDFLP